MDSRLKVLLVEDDQAACKQIIDEVNLNPDDFILIGITNNSTLAFEYVSDKHPDAVILDLELHHGGGDGLDFLQKLKTSHLSHIPFVLVTTNNVSQVTHEIVRSLGADFIMTKNQEGYSAKSVLEFLKITKSVIINRREQIQQNGQGDSPAQTAKKLQQRICRELDKVGVSPKSIGYTYLIDAIAMTVKQPVQHICDRIGEIYRKSAPSVERAMQNAINRAWKTADIQDLLDNYTAKIKSDKGVPTVTEFICYYAQKIKNDL
ncbi:MAG: sporulation initiation factor Spo0A C-terminal domain-containing protein [Candidatus Coproplasma sp.]